MQSFSYLLSTGNNMISITFADVVALTASVLSSVTTATITIIIATKIYWGGDWRAISIG